MHECRQLRSVRRSSVSCPTAPASWGGDLCRPLCPPLKLLQRPQCAGEIHENMYQCAGEIHETRCAGEIHGKMYRCAGEIHETRCAGKIHETRCAGEIHKTRCAGEIHKTRFVGEIHEDMYELRYKVISRGVGYPEWNGTPWCGYFEGVGIYSPVNPRP